MLLTLLNKQHLDDDIYLFTFKPQQALSWKAGQEIELTVKHAKPDNLGITRTFSIASAPFEKNILIITHCADNASTFKQALHKKQIGETVEASQPWGEFVIDDPKKEYTFVAAGVGISPYRAILMDLDYHNLPINVTLIYSHTSGNFPFKEEIEELLDRQPHFQVFYNIDPQQIERPHIKEEVGKVKAPIFMSGIHLRKIENLLSPTHETISPQENYCEEDRYLRSLWGE